MASGNTLCVFTPLHNEPPASIYALLGSRNAHPTLEFDAATDWQAVFSGVLPRNYNGNGLTITLVWMGASATSGNVIWTATIERIADGGHDLDADSWGTTVTATAAAASATSGKTTYTTIALTSGAQMDSLAAGEAFRLLITRDADNAADTMTGNAQLIRVEIRET